MHLIFIGRSVFVDKNNNIFAKINDYNYWRDLVSEGNTLSLILFRNNSVISSSEYSYQLSRDIFDIHLVDSTSSIKIVIYAILKIKQIANNYSIFFFYFPNTINLFIWFSINSNRKVNYWGNYWFKSYLATKSSYLDRIKAHFLHLFQVYLLNSKFPSIVAGDEIYNLANNPRYSNVFLTKPFLPFNINDVIREKSKKNDNVYRIIYVGVFTKRKNIKTILHSFYLFNKLHPSSELSLIGKGPLLQDILNFITKYNLEDKIKVCGYVGSKSKLKDIYTRSDVIILASFSEGFPRVLYEAMIFSVNVVTVDVGGISNLLKNNIHCLIVEDNTPEEFCRNLNLLFNNKMLASRLRENSTSLILDLLLTSPSHQHAKLIREYCENLSI